MKKVFLQFILLLLLTDLTFAQTNVYDSIHVGGHWRTYMTHLPTGYNVSNYYPLVLAFHGGGAPNYLSFQYQSRLTPKSDTAGFILVYPEGVKIAGGRTWNAGFCCAPSSSLNINDVGFVSKLLDTLFKARPIDTTRVYATGFSNGSLLCYRLADQLSKRFAAIGPVAGDLVYYPWNPSKPIPIINFHSYLDQNIKYFGGLTVGPSGTFFPPQDSMLNIIGTNYSCTILKDTLYHNMSQFDHFKYTNCNCNSVIEQYVSYDGDHSWPGGVATSSTSPVSNKFSATYLMWQFFQNYTTSCLTTGIENINETNIKIQAFPNPFSNKINLTNTTGKEIFTLINYFGHVIWIGKNIEQQDFSNLSNGLYFLRIDNRTIKLLKQ